MNVKEFMGLIRAWSLPMTLTALLLGFSYAYYLGYVATYYGVLYWLIASVGALLLHMSVNVLNDYYDTVNGVDRADSPTAKYRVHPILSGVVTPCFARNLGFLLMTLGIAAGLYVAIVEVNPWIVILGSMGVFILYAYTGKPFTIKYRGFGELVVSLVYGPLLVSGGFVAASMRAPGVDVIVVSMPLFLITLAIIYSNYYRDRDYDRSAGIKTLAMLTSGYGYTIYASSLVLAFLAVILMTALKLLPMTTLMVIATAPLLPGLLRDFRIVAADIDARTGRLYILFSILYSVGLILSRLL
ncbi:prenyltransferase [Vulcanisaeta thermophila]|uniref:prenyltransferase n=1 Tax=Vulcanisaeta thermophila TaxID=867917 RepID=UPI0008529E6E|nr:prenyltransferase [Vulcanisaeta thermophila]